ncbi:BID domain-containing T4SS effector [Bartonella sp. CB169]|uniref:BID domain-containing T4SS effector n=1 Tax=Bartonella sp. CB169 TaxID=3112257 RepID=UPI00300E37A3
MLEHNYLYKNSTTLKNKYGIRNKKKLYERCAHDAARAAVNFRYEPPPKKFNIAYLKLIHWSLFHKSFEWAGQTRDKSFVFEDGTTARMPNMRPKGHEFSFATGSQIQTELKQLEQMLTKKNNLRGLSRKEFAENAAEVFIALNHVHPFRKGNGRVQRMFLEKVGQAAGHRVDFSFITQERMTFACIEAMQHGNPQPMKDLFEDITNPKKALVLKEFISKMKSIEHEKINNCIVIAAKEGIIYNGVFRNFLAEGFVIEVEGTLVIGHKDDLSPEQIKSLQNGAHIFFQASNFTNLKETLIPKERLAPLTNEDLFARTSENPFVQALQKKIENLSKLVYGNAKLLNPRIDIINADPKFGKQFATQIIKNPKSISKLTGNTIFGIKSPDRKQAEEKVLLLSETFYDYAKTVQKTKEEILEQYQREQQRLGQSVEKPEKNLQNLFALSPEQQKEALSQSPALQQQVHLFARQLQNRLSPEDHKAIQEKKHAKLADMLGVSESKATEIATIVKQTKEAQYQMRAIKANRISSLAFTG